MIIPPIRKGDIWGSGEYLAPRTKNVNGKIVQYHHKGVDYCCYPDSVFSSDLEGTVEKLWYAYGPASKKKEYRSITIRIDPQTYVKYLYIFPSVVEGETIKVGDVLGITQDLTKHFKGMTPHYHFEVWIEGQHVNPDIWLREYMKRR